MYQWSYALIFLCIACFFNVAAASDLEIKEVGVTRLQSAFELRREWLENRGIVAPDIQFPDYINNLIFSDSPYLLSHSLQQVNWLQWQDGFNEGSGDRDKLLFISIGYSTCHWCHVMAEETFDDPEVADILNAHYVSVKVDREQWPLVDHRFKSASEVLNGEAGWPLNAILTPEGHLIWIDSYLTKDKFVRVIAGLAKRWKKKPQAIEALVRRIELQLSSDEPVVDIEKSEIVTDSMWRKELPKQHQKIYLLLQQEQESEGPRFIRANWGVGLLEEYLRTQDKQILFTVEKHVNSLLLSPTYDAVEGGFHRYAIDGQWLQPHYEKMLYTQANTIRLLSRLYAITGKQTYKSAIEQTRDWVSKWLYQESGYASAVSAISAGKEGGYYQVNSQQLLSDLLVGQPGMMSAPVKGSTASLIALSVLSEDWVKSRTVNKAKVYRNTLAKPAVDEKVLVSWNSMYAIALLEAYDVTQELEYFQQAESLLNRLWGASVNNGKAYRSIFHDTVSIDANLEDYAWFALAQIKMSFYQPWPMGNPSSLSQRTFVGYSKADNANARATWLLDRLTQMLADEKQYKSLLSLDRDDELPSIKGLVYEALFKGYQVLQKRDYIQQAKRLSSIDKSTLDGLINQYSFIGHLSNRYHQAAINNAFFAKGHGRMTALMDGKNILLKFDLQPGWHINANNISNDKLIPTVVTMKNKNDYDISYPGAVYRKLSFIDTDLALYEGQFEIELQSTSRSELTQSLDIQVQACSDKLCLLPEFVKLHIMTH